MQKLCEIYGLMKDDLGDCPLIAGMADMENLGQSAAMWDVDAVDSQRDERAAKISVFVRLSLKRPEGSMLAV